LFIAAVWHLPGGGSKYAVAKPNGDDQWLAGDTSCDRLDNPRLAIHHHCQ
jgi:hypothetical protein